MGLLKEFKEFAMRGNVVDMAVGVVIGGAFGKIVTSLVADIMTPPINYVMTFFSDAKGYGGEGYPLRVADKANDIPAIYLKWPTFVGTVVDFLIVAFCLFIVIKAMNTLKRKKEEAPPAPSEPPADVKLLTEIRDLLKAKT